MPRTMKELRELFKQKVVILPVEPIPSMCSCNLTLNTLRGA